MDPALIAPGVAPTLANTVDGALHRPPHARLEPVQRRLPGRPGHQRPAAGRQRLPDLAAPRLRLRPDRARATTIVRGGSGIFYDRPQGNMVFDMIANAPGVLVSTLQWGRLQDLTAGRRRSQPDAVAQPDGLRLQAAEGLPVERRRPAQAVAATSSSTSPTWAPSRRTCCARCRSTRCRSAPRSCPRTRIRPARRARRRARRRCPNDLLRPYPGYGNIRMWDYSGYANYHALQTSVTRRFDNGFMFSAFYVWSKALGINNNDFAAGVPNLTEEETRRLDYSLLRLRPAAQLRGQLHLPDAEGRERRARRAGERLADLGHLPLDERPAVRRQLLDSRASAPRTSPAPTATRTRASCSPATRAAARAAIRTGRSTRRASRRRSRAATAPSRRASSCARRRSTTSTCRSRRTSRSARASSSRCASTRSTR